MRDLKRIQDAKLPGTEYQRETKSTRRTAVNLHRIVEFVRDNPRCTQGDIAGMLCYSMSGARKYCYTLEKSGVLDVMTGPKNGNHYPMPQYSLSDDPELIAAFLENTKTLSLGRKPGNGLPAPRRKIGEPQLMPGTHVHMSQDDDEIYMRRLVKNAKIEVKRDPMDQWFFGDGPARSLVLEAEAV
jgi:hypothetical protein